MRFIALVTTVLFLIVGIKLCLTGNILYDEAQHYTQPQHESYQAFGEDRPLQGWYEVSGCIIDLTEGAYRSAQVNTSADTTPTQQDDSKLLRDKEVYVPVHDAQAPTDKAYIILYSRDPDLVSAVKSLVGTPEASSHSTALRVIRGMVRVPAELPERVRRVLGSSITTQSIIIEEYAAPSPARAWQMMGAGGTLILSTAILWMAIWRRDRQVIDIPEGFMPDADYDDDLVDDAE